MTQAILRGLGARPRPTHREIIAERCEGIARMANYADLDRRRPTRTGDVVTRPAETRNGILPPASQGMPIAYPNPETGLFVRINADCITPRKVVTHVIR